jgi:hypothetical protein
MKNIISIIQSTIIKVLFLFLLSISILPLWLSYGIHIERIALKNVTIENISLELNQKMNSTIDTIKIHPQSSNSTIDTQKIITIIDWSSWLLKGFNQITIHNLSFKEENLTIEYKNSHFYAHHREGELTASYTTIYPNIVLNLEKAIYFDQNITASGKLYLNLSNMEIEGNLETNHKNLLTHFYLFGNQENIEFKTTQSFFNFPPYEGSFVLNGEYSVKNSNAHLYGRIEIADIVSKIDLAKKEDILHINLYNTQIKTLEYLVDIIEIDEELKPWLYGNILAKNYLLDALYLPFNVKTKEALLDELDLSAQLSNVDIKWDQTLPAAKAEALHLRISNSTLFAKTTNAVYQHNPIDMNLSIPNLFKAPYLNLDILSDTHIDDTIHQILAASDIDIRFLDQSKGMNQTHFHLGMPLSKSATKPFEVSSFTHTISSNLDIFELPILLNQADITLHNNLINITNANVNIPPYIDFNTSTRLDTKLQKLDSLIHINHSVIGGDDIFSMHDLDAHIDMTYHNGVKVTIPEFTTTIKYKNETLDVKIEDIKPLIPFSLVMKIFNIKDGSIRFTQKENKIVATAFLKHKSEVLTQDGALFNNYFLDYEHSNNQNFLNINNTIFVNFDNNSTQINIENLDIHVAKFLKKYNQKSEQRSYIEKYKKESTTKPAPLHLFAKNSKFYYEERIIPADTYSLFIDDPYMSFDLEYKNTKVLLDKVADKITLSAKNIDTDFTKDLFKFELATGTVDLLTTGSLSDKEFYGVMKIKDATIKGYSVVNNIIAFVNTVPSLITFNYPGFNKEGFAIKKGQIEYYITSQRVFIKSIRLIGINTDIFGYGEINLEDNSIDLTITLSTIKGLSNLVSKIPLVGYVLLGEDQSIGTVIKVEGDLLDPLVSSSFGSDAILYPFSLIKRAVEWPLRLFEPLD